MTIHTPSPFKMSFMWPALLSLALAACQTPPSATPQEGFPLVTGEEVISVAINVPFGRKSLGIEEKNKIGRLVSDYIDRGKGQVVIETGPGYSGSDIISARIQKVRGELVNAGLRHSEIRIWMDSPGGADNDNVVVSYQANAVKVPECGDWTSSSSYNWSNRRHSNFGCSIQRNLGLTVADPGDLSRSKAQTSRDPARVSDVITKHRAAGPTGASHSTAGAAE